jgi:phosphatidylglycerophosphatase C
VITHSDHLLASGSVSSHKYPQGKSGSTPLLVFFDFDCTLTTRDTIWPFVTFLLNHRPYKQTTRIVALVLTLMLRLRLIANDVFKKYFAWLLLRGESEQSMMRVVARFHDMHLASILNQCVMDCLVRHGTEGKDVYLVSSNFDFVLNPLKEPWKLKGILATQAEVVNGVFTGRLVGRNCHGKEKVSRVIAEFGEDRAKEAIAYGDSVSDLLLLNFVNVGYWIRPGCAPRSCEARAA